MYYVVFTKLYRIAGCNKTTLTSKCFISNNREYTQHCRARYGSERDSNLSKRHYELLFRRVKIGPIGCHLHDEYTYVILITDIKTQQNHQQNWGTTVRPKEIQNYKFFKRRTYWSQYVTWESMDSWFIKVNYISVN